MGLKRRQLKILLFILICILLYSTWTIVSNQSELSNDDFIRFHVIANSDSAEDQALKLKVRDGVLAKINSELVRETMAQELAVFQVSGAAVMNRPEDEGGQARVSLDLEQSRKYIQENLTEIEATAERIIQENGYQYPVKAELGVKWIPQKTYGNVIFPSGNYEALNVTIGEGKGQNWWCVLFPPLCLIGAEPADDDELAEEAQEIYKEILLDKKYEPLTEEREKPATLKLKFKTLELIDELDK
ncbi:MAG TPA: stage II sporulation protein R, partial [Anaerovoracaceae bacterium]|nr:stage II sporulation protein R [Anaerovoracaceae bacterium]